MAKRLIVPTLQTMTVAGGIGEVDVPQLPGIPGRVLTYLVIQSTLIGAPVPKGIVQVTDEDNSQVIFQDPKPGGGTVALDF